MHWPTAAMVLSCLVMSCVTSRQPEAGARTPVDGRGQETSPLAQGSLARCEGQAELFRWGVTVLEARVDAPTADTGRCAGEQSESSYRVDAQVSGWVLDSEGVPLADAIVWLTPAQGGGQGTNGLYVSDSDLGETVQTDASGAFRFDGVRALSAPTALVLSAHKEGYRQETLLFRCGAVKAELRLRRDCVGE